MGDLESIKALLEEDELEAIPETLSEALNPLPVLEDEIQDETEDALDALSADTDAEVDVDVPVIVESLNSFDPATGLSEPIAPSNLEQLLGDEFHDATAEVMQRARGLINQHANRWSPQQTDELADALRVRIDAAVAGWIKTSLDAHALELQQRLLNAVRDELARHLEAFEHAPE